MIVCGRSGPERPCASWTLILSPSCPSHGAGSAIRVPTCVGQRNSFSFSSTYLNRRRSFAARLRTGTFVELLIDCEKDQALRAVLVGMLREMGR